jgi:hypothetical protein
MIPSRQFIAIALVVAGTALLALAAGGVVGAQDRRAAPADSATQQTSAQQAPEGDETAPSLRPLFPLEERNPTGQTAQQAIDAHLSASDGPEQPIPFSHRFHTQEIGMQCTYCHGGTESSAVATIPPVELCMGCHRIVGAELEPIQKLRGYWDRGEPVAWERIHKLPDFVQFPHEAHIRNELACSECHGAVEEMDRVSQVSSLKMGWCLECHMGEGQESDYATDRLLSAQFPPPAMPEGRQPVGLYPRAIDERYGATRGPIDCTACHY